MTIERCQRIVEGRQLALSHCVHRDVDGDGGPTQLLARIVLRQRHIE